MKKGLAKRWVDSAQIILKAETTSEDDRDAAVELLELCSHDPRTALNVIYEIISLTQNPRILGYLGAGPLEEILVHDCERFMDELIDRSQSDPHLLRCLRSVEIYSYDCPQEKRFYDAINGRGAGSDT